MSHPQIGFKDANVRGRTMLRQFPVTLVLGLALLFSQEGVLLVAALCPHLGLATPTCDMPSMDLAVDHSQMGHGDMDHHNPLPAPPDSDNTGKLIEYPGQPCSHCVIHSRSNLPPVLVRSADTTKRSTDFDVPQGVVVLHRNVPLRVAVLMPREHGPPGQSSRAKHILINTFRI